MKDKEKIRVGWLMDERRGGKKGGETMGAFKEWKEGKCVGIHPTGPCRCLLVIYILKNHLLSTIIHAGLNIFLPIKF